MAGFKRTRYLTCFYCGGKTSTPYGPSVRNFDCPSCEATNYLDENGEITDPPVATTSAFQPTAVQYAVPQALAPAAVASSNDVFCDTCIKNQRLFTASLAQYLPDPDAPDYAELEKKYYKFRRSAEERYPQICARCEPRVRERMEQAAYTAKTDTLRRMINRSRKTQHASTRTGLDYAAALGRGLWLAALASQVLWHVSIVRNIVEDSLGLGTNIWVSRCLGMLDIVLDRLPAPARLATWSVAASVSSIWWNPRLVQTWRGFTRHIIGLPIWYTYQFVTLFIRAMFFKLLGAEAPEPALMSAYVAMHCFGLALAVFLYFRGINVVRIDTAPLFAPSPLRPLPQRPDTPKRDEDKNMAEILDEILQTPASPSHQVSLSKRPDLGNPTNVQSRGFAGPVAVRRDSNVHVGSLQLSDLSPAEYEEEMDWTPTHSKHRAFNTYGQREGEGFNEAPTEPKGPFWYRVPPPPTTPAQRVFNPPNQPRLQTSPGTQENPFARSNGAASARGLRRRGETGPDDDEAPKAIKFAEPKFFSQPSQSDPRNSLSDLFDQSFSLSQEEQAERERNRGWLGGFGFGSGSRSGSGKKET
ncbi:hypothetical protein GQ53DRAFT_813522 [Thozetella sp. PMI_491]|nr:hypothetical protein GQ53DRAFT_813522 [Thozetella sp. PMI_491]